MLASSRRSWNKPRRTPTAGPGPIPHHRGRTRVQRSFSDPVQKGSTRTRKGPVNMTLNRRRRRLVTVLAGVAAGMAVAVGAALLATGPADAHTQNVRLLQRDLVGLAYLPTGGVDGIYGPHTTAAVRDFQADAGIKVDGDAGDVTMGKLTKKVKEVQGKAHVKANGDYASGTTAAVRRWQSAHH